MSKRIVYNSLVVGASLVATAVGMVLTGGTASAASCQEDKANLTVIDANFYVFETGNYTHAADGLMSANDLNIVAYNSRNDVIRAAANYVIVHEMFHHIDRAVTGNNDGLASQSDVKTVIRQLGCR